MPSCSKLRRLVEWALTSIIASDGTAAVGLPTPEKVAHDPTVCQNQAYLGHDALRQPHLLIREGGLGLTNSSIKGAAYIGCHALVLGLVVAASARRNLPSLLERLPERPMASARIEELRIVATEAKRSQTEDVESSCSLAAHAAEEDPQGRGIGTLPAEAGGWGGGGGREGRSGGEMGGGGARCWTARTIGGPLGNPA